MTLTRQNRAKNRQPFGSLQNPRPSITMSERGVYHLLKRLGPSTAADLVKFYPQARRFLDRGYRYPEQQPSGIRTRLSALVGKGYIEDTGERIYQDGSSRKRTIWRAL